MLNAVQMTWRRLSRRPGFAVVAVLSMGLGIGLAAVSAKLLDDLLYRVPAHVRDPDRIARVYVVRQETPGTSSAQAALSYPAIKQLRNLPSFDVVAAYSNLDLPISIEGSHHLVRATLVDAYYFDLLGTNPWLGRVFSASRKSPLGERNGVVLSFEFWRSRFAGEPTSLGREVRVGDQLFPVIGVLPPEFTGPDFYRRDLWMLLSGVAPFVYGPQWETSSGWTWLLGIARLNPGTSLETAGGHATTLMRRLGSEFGTARIILGPLSFARGPEATIELRMALWASSAASLLLLIACANFVGLLGLRILETRREIQIRFALGASPFRSAAHVIAEIVILSACGALCAIAIAAAVNLAMRPFFFVRAVPPPLLSPALLLGTIFVSALVGVVAAAGVVLQVAAIVRSTDRIVPKHAILSRSKRTRTWLLTGQVAMTVTLATAAGVLLISLKNANVADLGFDLENLVYLPLSGAYVPGERDPASEALLERSLAHPSVVNASLASNAPLLSTMQYSVWVQGIDSQQVNAHGGPYFNAVSPDFFATLRLSLVEGRFFTESDIGGSQPVVIVNETFARLAWPNGTPLGKCVRVGGNQMRCRDVVGIVRDTRRFNLHEARAVQYYIPLAQSGSLAPQRLLVLRVSSPGAIAAVLDIARQFFPSSPLLRVVHASHLISPELAPIQLSAALFSSGAAAAVVLVLVGLYSQVGYWVSQRQHEIGIKLAIGATPDNILWSFTKQGVKMAVPGIVVGLVLSLIATQKLGTLAYDVAPRHPAILLGSCILVLSAATVASYASARRTVVVDPLVVLRAE